MKKLTVHDKEGKSYVLEFTKSTIIQMETSGFDIDAFTQQPVRMATLLFHGAFLANHQDLRDDEVESIYAGLKKKKDLLRLLLEAYNEQTDLLVEEGNVEWEASW